MTKMVCVVESTFTNGKIYHQGAVVDFAPNVKVNEKWWKKLGDAPKETKVVESFSKKSNKFAKVEEETSI